MHGLLLIALIISAVKVPHFLVTFVALSACIVISLVGFVFLVQLPVRYFASRLRGTANTSRAARAKLS